jgi:hypothetical protein
MRTTSDFFSDCLPGKGTVVPLPITAIHHNYTCDRLLQGDAMVPLPSPTTRTTAIRAGQTPPACQRACAGVSNSLRNRHRSRPGTTGSGRGQIVGGSPVESSMTSTTQAKLIRARLSVEAGGADGTGMSCILPRDGTHAHGNGTNDQSNCPGSHR